MVNLQWEPAQDSGSRRFITPLLGRDIHLRLVGRVVQNLDQGTGGLIWLSGSVGVGKSRLMDELRRSLAQGGVLVARSVCLERQSDQVLSAFGGLLSDLFGLRSPDTSDRIRAKIERKLAAWGFDPAPVRPYLEWLVGVEPAGDDLDLLAGLAPEQRRRQCALVLRRTLQGIARHGPVALLIDDLHWSDPTSACLLRNLVDVTRTAPILFVCSHDLSHTGTASQCLEQVYDLSPEQCVKVFLGGLTRPEREDMLTNLLNGKILLALPAELLAAILTRREGNPLYLHQVARWLLQDRSRLAGSAPGSMTSFKQILADFQVPGSLDDLLLGRLDLASPDLRTILKVSSVLGQAFRSRIAGAILGRNLPAEALEELAERGFLGLAAESGDWDFYHPTMGLTAYREMDAGERQRLHGKAAEILAARRAGTGAGHAADQAYHLARSLEPSSALEHLVLVGERASFIDGGREALAAYAEAARIVEQQENRVVTVRRRILAGLGDAYHRLGQYGEAIQVLSRTLTTWEGGKPDDREQARLLLRLGESSLADDALEDAMDYFVQALDILGEPTEVSEQAEVAAGLMGLAATYLRRGNLQLAIDTCSAARAHAERAGSLNALAAVDELLAEIHRRLGEWDVACRYLWSVAQCYERQGYTQGTADALAEIGPLLLAAGDWQQAATVLEQALARHQELGNLEGKAAIHYHLGRLGLHRGDLVQGLVHFRASLTIAQPLQLAFYAAQAVLGLAEILLAQGTWEEAEQAGSQAAALAAEVNRPDLEATAWRIVSECLRCQDNLAAAQESLGLAWRLLDRDRYPLAYGQVAIQATRLALQADEPAQAGE